MRRTGPCDRERPADEFYDGRGRCMDCIRAIERERYWRNRAARLALANAYWNRTKAERKRQSASPKQGEWQCRQDRKERRLNARPSSRYRLPLLPCSGRWPRERREALGWTPATLAFHAGMTAQQVRNIEVGRTKKPHQATMRQLEQALAKGERRRTDKEARSA